MCHLSYDAHIFVQVRAEMLTVVREASEIERELREKMEQVRQAAFLTYAA